MKGEPETPIQADRRFRRMPITDSDMPIRDSKACRSTGASPPSRARDGHDLLEVLDDRYARRGTLLASQVPVEHWHDVVGDPTFGDSILDRLLNNAHRITLKGGSMRRLYDSTKPPRTTPGDA